MVALWICCAAVGNPGRPDRCSGTDVATAGVKKLISSPASTRERARIWCVCECVCTSARPHVHQFKCNCSLDKYLAHTVRTDWMYSAGLVSCASQCHKESRSVCKFNAHFPSLLNTPANQTKRLEYLLKISTDSAPSPQISHLVCRWLLRLTHSKLRLYRQHSLPHPLKVNLAVECGEKKKKSTRLQSSFDCKSSEPKDLTVDVLRRCSEIAANINAFEMSCHCQEISPEMKMTSLE